MKEKLPAIVIISLLGLNIFFGASTQKTVANSKPFSPYLQFLYQHASRYWNSKPFKCISVTKEVTALPRPVMGEATVGLGNDPVHCKVVVSRLLERRKYFQVACAVMIHEYGHLLGFNHSVRKNVMNKRVYIPNYCVNLYYRRIKHNGNLRPY